MNKKLKLWELNRVSEEEFKAQQKFPLIVILDDIRSLNNIGSFFRTADAFNVEKIVELLQRAEQEKVQVVCFPELSVTAYTCADLFFQEKLLLDAEKMLSKK